MATKKKLASPSSPDTPPAPIEVFQTETVLLSELKPHPRNYRKHPEDQIAHLIQSIQEHGMYRNIIIACDGTILAGHGVAEAAKKMGLKTIPVKRIDRDPDDPRALKLLAADNEIGHLAEIDDRILTEILKGIKEADESGLIGTGYDEKMLANLAMVTRPASEIKDHNEAAEWIGMPEYEEGSEAIKVTVSFRSAEDRATFFQLIDAKTTEKTKAIWWPAREQDDLESLRFVEKIEDE